MNDVSSHDISRTQAAEAEPAQSIRLKRSGGSRRLRLWAHIYLHMQALRRATWYHEGMVMSSTTDAWLCLVKASCAVP